jgi:S-adenosylmethionine:tRNA-ribosyltransferase-isomerase (queuine synthetase)
MGLERMRAAYAHAIAEQYRFYGYDEPACCSPEVAKARRAAIFSRL